MNKMIAQTQWIIISVLLFSISQELCRIMFNT